MWTIPHIFKQIHTPIKGCSVLQLISNTTCKSLLSFRIWHVHWVDLCNERFSRTKGEMLNMKTCRYFLVLPLEPQTHSVRLCIEMKVIVIYASWLSPHFRAFTMSQLHWHGSFKQAEEPSTHLAKLIHRRKKYLLAQSYTEQKGHVRIFRNAQGTGHTTPIKNWLSDFMFL